jgi:hypothetical protein
MEMGRSERWIALGVASIGAFGILPLEAKSGLNDHFSVYGEFVYMRRADIHNHSLVRDSNKRQCAGRCPDYTVISSGDLVNDFDFEPGYRVGAAWMINAKNSIEGNFLYLQPWSGDKSAHGDASLSFPFSNADYSFDFTDADKAHAKYWSHFWDAELNYWRHFNPRRVNFFSLSGIAGLRYFWLDEKFTLAMIQSPDRSTYHTHTENRMYGAQLGLDFQMNPTRWLSWEIFAKAGAFGNVTEQKQFLGDFDNTVVLRDSERDKTELGIFTDVAAQVDFRFWEHFNIHGGYQALFFSGLALAPEQVSKRVGENAGKKDRTNGNAIIHGLFVGLGVSF